MTQVPPSFNFSVWVTQVVKKGRVQLQNRLVPDSPVREWVRRIDDLQPDIDRVLQVGIWT